MVEPLSDNANLSLEEAQEKLKEIQRVFDGYKTQYDPSTAPLLPPEAKKELTDCFNGLIPLLLQPSVKQEANADPKNTRSTFYQTSGLMDEFIKYLDSFNIDARTLGTDISLHGR